ncbi:hypothetical protein DV711_06060 [Motiliproteus coralliicola]|uniref:Uncharacterized protein n=1 Tax=Motiliproteus coralliicola TaxID=2283196 RepID=A0A369WVQ0_9GAMM|nr:hypothetical protein [Motiliproteus coralliicola]RDE25119.1 hypothetical protein DV711_06060 [Motiliproteus coralliicola]
MISLVKVALLQVAKAILKAALDEDALKPFVVDLLKKWAESTKSDVDDTYVANIEAAMKRENERVTKKS